MATNQLDKLVSRLEAVTTKLESVFSNRNDGFTCMPVSEKCHSSGNKPAVPEKPKFDRGVIPTMDLPRPVKAFDDAIHEPMQILFDSASKLGDDVKDVTKLTKDAFQALRSFLCVSYSRPKPTDDAEFSKLLKPISEKIDAVQSLKNGKRNSEYFNHLSAIAEGIPALGWVTVSPTPAPYVKEMTEASQFYTNRVLKDYKEKEPFHADWAKSWLNVLSNMQSYVKQYHTTGLVWNTQPGATSSAVNPMSSVKLGLPAPPPPPPPTYLQGLDSKSISDDPRVALFADINKGLDVTKGLKKVTDDQKTHKNPALKQQAALAPANGNEPKGMSTTTRIPASPSAQRKVELIGGKKWIVEHVTDDQSVIINVTNKSQVVYIFKCSNSIIQIKGKVNSVTMDNCNKSSVVFDDLVGAFEIINCQRVKVQSMGTLPTLTVQKTDDCEIYLSSSSLSAEIVTSKSSNVNVLVPKSDGDYAEHPVPEQYKTIWDGSKLKTTVVDNV